MALLAAYPLWWALGVAQYMVLILAIPATAHMVAWRRRRDRKIRVPAGFGIWLLFLICMLAGILMITMHAPETVSGSLGNRVISFVIRAANYIAVTVFLLYAGNLTEREFPRQRLAWLLGLVAIYAVVGGIGGTVLPNFQFTSPLALLIPHSLQNSTLAGAQLHPGLSQVQSVLGGAEGRPKAPFDYTNDWGFALSELLPWLLVGWWSYGSRRNRWIAGIALGVVLVPIVYSLNRGAWIGLGLSVIYLAGRLAARGKLGLIAGLSAALVVITIGILATPLQGLIVSRLQNGQSDQIRSALSGLAVREAVASPILGFGDTRHQQGSPSSISVGPSATCARCGQSVIGSTGQLWLLLICNGFLGAALYLGFFAYGAWRYRRDRSLYGLAGVAVLLLTFVYMFTYTSEAILIAFAMFSYALLWRNETEQRSSRTEVAL